MTETKEMFWVGVDGHGTWLRPRLPFGRSLLNDGVLSDFQVEVLRNEEAFRGEFSNYSTIIPFDGPRPNEVSHIVRALRNPLAMLDPKSERFLVEDRLYAYKFDWAETEGAHRLSQLPDDQVRLTFQSAIVSRLGDWVRGRFSYPSIGDDQTYPDRWQYLDREIPAILRKDETVFPLVSKAFSTGMIVYEAYRESRETGGNKRKVIIAEDSFNAALQISRALEVSVYIPVSESDALAQPRFPLCDSLTRGFDDLHFADKSLMRANSGLLTLAGEIAELNRRNFGQTDRYPAFG